MDIEDVLNEVLEIIRKWAQNGEKLLPVGVRLICPTPHVAPEAWLHVIFPKLSARAVETLEKRLNTSLPHDFRCFLRKQNGLELFSSQISIFGARGSWAREGDEAWQPFDLVSHNVESDRPTGSPPSILYFAAGDGGDSRYFFEFDEKGYRVGKTGRDEFLPHAYWQDFGTWLLDEVNTLAMLYDSKGVMLAGPPTFSG